MKTKGFIDIHTHGAGRYDTRTENPEDILKIAEIHASSGTSAILPAIYSGTIQQMRGNMEAVRKAMKVQSSKLKVKSCKEKNSKFKIQNKTSHFLLLTSHLFLVSTLKARF